MHHKADTSLSPNVINQLRFDATGLIPAIAKDWLESSHVDGGLDELRPREALKPDVPTTRQTLIELKFHIDR